MVVKRRLIFIMILMIVIFLVLSASCSSISRVPAGSEENLEPGETLDPAEEASAKENSSTAEKSVTEREQGADYSSKSQQLQAEVEGNVSNPFVFTLDDFSGQEITIKAEMRKCKETVPAREFTGIPLSVILNKAEPVEGSSKLTIIGADDYSKNYVLEDVLINEVFIISKQGGGLQIIAENSERYDASYWVMDVVKLVVK